MIDNEAGGGRGGGLITSRMGGADQLQSAAPAEGRFVMVRY